MKFQSRSKILWPQTLLPDRDAAGWGGLNKQTFYILSYQTYLNMDVFQIVFSVFSLIRVSAPKLGQSGSQVSDVVAVGACWVRVVISSLGRV